MQYGLCIRKSLKEFVFKIQAGSLEEARNQFIRMKQMTEEQFDEIFIVVEVKNER